MSDLGGQKNKWKAWKNILMLNLKYFIFENRRVNAEENREAGGWDNRERQGWAQKYWRIKMQANDEHVE